MSTPRLVYAKMDVNLDSSRKIRRAGRNGRDVFLWVLRQVSMRDAQGSIPSDDLEDHEWLADQLMCSVADVADGIAAALRVRLIEIHDGACYVVGWDDEWAKRPMTGSERNARYKARRRTSPGDAGDGPPSPVTMPRHPVTQVTDNVTGDAGKERKGKERDEDARHPGKEPGGLFAGITDLPKTPTLADQLAEAACAEINRLTGSHYEPAAKATADLCARLAKAGHTVGDVLLVVRDKHAEWAPNPEMRKRIVPGTLLALANFERYLDDLRSRPAVALAGPEVRRIRTLG